MFSLAPRGDSTEKTMYSIATMCRNKSLGVGGCPAGGIGASPSYASWLPRRKLRVGLAVRCIFVWVLISVHVPYSVWAIHGRLGRAELGGKGKEKVSPRQPEFRQYDG